MLAPHWRTWRLEDTETGVSGNRRAPPAHRNRSIRHAVSGRAACRDVIAALPSLRALLTPHQATADSARRLTQLPQGRQLPPGARSPCNLIGRRPEDLVDDRHLPRVDGRLASEPQPASLYRIRPEAVGARC